MKRIFISQPMRNKPKEEIKRERNEIIKKLKEKYRDKKIEIVNSYFDEYPGEINKHVPIWYLSKSIEILSTVDVVYFGNGWKNARGCIIENKIAKDYNLEVMEE